ncbi:hypothetical protein [Actinacidiphila oryziradicis]|uniref:hypothetical protein n=1 Tax=Actinacidiphila oryziradicis TaxID=2571141 RepID=UPI00145EC390|nr:hypothetical protein [Actinacidiphila oryziradicis]
MSTEAGQTPGLRVSLRRSVGHHGFLLHFGPDGLRIEAITEAQAMTLGLVLSSSPRPSS